MTDQRQLKRLQTDVDKWNIWREQHPRESINLSGARLRGWHLNGADLNGADLNGAHLDGARLNGADLNGVHLDGARLNHANLSSTYLRYAHLNGAHLDGARLNHADLSGARLNHANLSSTYLRYAHLNDAHLDGARLNHADLSGANLSGANLSGAYASNTIFDDVDLRLVKGLETIMHGGPSGITTRTLERSQGDIPEVFLRGAGLSDTFIEYARSLVQSPIQYYTCFLSYSNKDHAFAERLYNDLQGSGVRCWYARKDLKPGDFYRHRIDESIKVYDKVVLILSEHSIKSTWVQEEVEKAWGREMQPTEPGEPVVLFPIRLDETVMQTERAWARQLRFLRHIGDFTGWKDHDAYQAHFQQLLRDLKQERPKAKA